MGPIIRQALPTEAHILSDLALRSKGHWGYSDDFLRACIQDLTITSEYVQTNPIYVLEQHGDIVGFYSFLCQGQVGKLDFLYVEPQTIGHGYGKRLWSHLLVTAKEIGLQEFTIDADPNAENFYQKMGAKRIGDIDSTVFPDRKLPLFQVVVGGEE